jgi:3-oxoacyl-[acyl-carrier protein] reductase
LENKKLAGMVAFVTGSGGGGIGTGIAVTLAKHGAALIVNDLNEELAAPTVEEIKAMGGEAISVVGDVSNTDDVNRMVNAAVEHYGKIDILVNSVGIGGRCPEIEHLPIEDWIKVIRVDLTAPFKMCRAVVPHMRKQQFGRIINIASVAAMRIGFVSGAPYSAAKAGLLGLTRHLAIEEGENKITVNAVMPGGTVTPKLLRNYSPEQQQNIGKDSLLGRLALPKDHGEAVAFLASKEAEHITGIALPVDGGSMIFGGDISAYNAARAAMITAHKSAAPTN